MTGMHTIQSHFVASYFAHALVKLQENSSSTLKQQHQCLPQVQY